MCIYIRILRLPNFWGGYSYSYISECINQVIIQILLIKKKKKEEETRSWRLSASCFLVFLLHFSTHWMFGLILSATSRFFLELFDLCIEVIIKKHVSWRKLDKQETGFLITTSMRMSRIWEKRLVPQNTNINRSYHVRYSVSVYFVWTSFCTGTTDGGWAESRKDQDRNTRSQPLEYPDLC